MSSYSSCNNEVNRSTALLKTPKFPLHEFEHRMESVAPGNMPPPEKRVDLIEIHDDNFIGMENATSNTHLLQIYRSMLYVIYSVFPPPKVIEHQGGDPVSENKLDNGEGLWDHMKEILVWVFN